MKHGFLRVAAAVPEIRVANCRFNAEKIIELIHNAGNKDIQFVCFPELSLTSCTCGDLFKQQKLINEAEEQLLNILQNTKDTKVLSIIGVPVVVKNKLYSCAAVIQSGSVLGVVPKTYIPGYSEFYEKRWFESGRMIVNENIHFCGKQIPFGTDLLFQASGYPDILFGIEICEDLWVTIPPSSFYAMNGAVMLFNLSASNEIVSKHEYRKKLVEQQSARCISAYIYTSSGIWESTTDLVYGGHALISEYGTTIGESKRFSSESQLICSDIDVQYLINNRLNNTSFSNENFKFPYRNIQYNLDVNSIKSINRNITQFPFVPNNIEKRDKRCEEIFCIQTSALARRMRYIGCKKAVIAISGGLDSTLALLVTTKTFDILGLPRKNIYTVTMPGFGTTDTTHSNAWELMKSLGTDKHEIDIKPSCIQHLKDIGHDMNIQDKTYENVQARERTQVIMDIANKIGGLAVGTGDLSELALGWCTYNGDHMSMYSVNCGIPKTLVKYMVKWVSENIVDTKIRSILSSILNTPITPELIPPGTKGEINQKTEDIIGPYELHDFFLYHAIRHGALPEKVLFLAVMAFRNKYTENTIKKWLKVFYKRFFSQQFKRSCMPDGPKVGTVSLSPRGDWRMPSDADVELWLKELE